MKQYNDTQRLLFHNAVQFANNKTQITRKSLPHRYNASRTSHSNLYLFINYEQLATYVTALEVETTLLNNLRISQMS
jgi:hypothetical protein